MEELESAKRKRIAAKGWLTRVANQLENLLERETISDVELEELIVEFEQKLRSVDETQSEVEQVIDIDELEQDIDVAAAFRNEKKTILVKGKERFRTIQGTEKDNSTNYARSESIRSEVQSLRENSFNGLNTKLPTLQLDKFSGNYTEWQTFWDKFCAVVDSSQIPVINKFTYLQTLLQGEAASAIKGLSLTSSNYDTAKDILEKRFGRPERIIFGHIQQLLENSGISSKENSSSSSTLWKLYDDIQNHVRSLQNLGVGGDKYGVFLTPLVLNQLPSTIRMEWARVGEGREGDLTFLLSFLYDEIRRRERSQTYESRNRGALEHKNSAYSKGRSPISTASALLAQGSSNKHCEFCKGDHYSDKCDEISSLTFEQRKEKIKKLGLCFLCLGHHLAKQCKRVCYFCKGMHHAVLCKRKIKEPPQTVAKSVAGSVHVGVSYAHSKDLTTLMQVVHTELHGTEVSIMFDSGSDRSFITKECARRLKLKVVDRKRLNYSCFGEDVSKEEEKEVFELNFGGDRIHLMSMKHICTPMYRSAIPKEVLSHFTDIPFCDDYSTGKSIKIDILIGLDWYWSLIKSQRGNPSDGLIAQQTVFGWMLSGVYSGKCSNGEYCRKSQSQILLCQSTVPDNIVRELWDLESIGISKDEVSDHCKEDQVKFMLSFSSNIDFHGGRYVVKLPWKNDQCKASLMNNREIAERRLICLNRKLEKDQPLREKYDAVLSGYEDEGIIQEISTDNELETTENPVFYLPHRPVVREDSLSTKVRPVFDASCKATNGLSLNDCMEVGPKLIPDLVQILLRFRKWKFGLTADIQKAFLQIKLHESDQDVHRFLWKVDDHIRTMKFERVCFGNACSPFLLNATIKHHLNKFQPSSTLKELQNNLYVDDWLTGADSEEEILNMITDADKVMRQGGFVLTKWTSSCKNKKEEILKIFDGFKEHDIAKVLGLSWNTDEDSFIFRTIPVPESCLFTKRLLLSTTARLFDPIGLLTPFTIFLKILFQDAWRKGYGWDETLPEEMQNALNRWMGDLEMIQNWRIPRCISFRTWKDSKQKELLIFADASEKAYGCCIYLKTTDGEQKSISLVMSRVKVAPLKKVTLPRLELLAALLAARLLKYVSSALGLEADLRYTCWTDSQIVLCWIKGDPMRWKQFVRNRVIEIQQLTDPCQWKHCSGDLNPADLLTRGVSANTLISSSKWLNGPDWLNDEELVDENMVLEEVDLIQDDMEVDSSTLCTVEVECLPIVDFKRFSSFGKLLRVITFVLMFSKKTRKIDVNDDTGNNLTEAKIVLFRLLQDHYYKREVGELKKGRTVQKGSPLGNLSPFIGEDGLLRVGGRLENAHALSYDEKHPLILPKCHVTWLLVKSQHMLLRHAGVNVLMTSLRNKYWIVSLRPIAKRVVRFCVSCQRQDSRLMDQCTGLLPESRITQSPPFSIVGIDYAGPLFCSDLPYKKLYILLFTCAVTRAIHLELVDSLNAADFCLSFKRFASRRAMPAVIYSDNAKTFRKAQALLNEHMGHEVIQWRKQPALAPWWGGFYERMVRSVKSGLRKSIGKRSIPRRELETALVEVEACINARPLIGTSDNDNYLTPSHFLVGRGCPLTPPVVTELNKVLDLSILDNYHRELLDRFWEIWRLEYVRALNPIRTGKRMNSGLKEGAMVLIQDTNQKRMLWDLGRVLKLFNGTDGCIRAAQIRTRTSVLVRPIQRLLLLELEQPSQQSDEPQDLPGAGEVFSSRTSTAINDNVEDQQVTNAPKSRSGRFIKPRTILDL